MSHKISLEALEVLDAIDRKGSFAAAAAALYKVPSAITYTMNKLEEDLEVILFRKEGRRSLLTPAGKVLLDQGRELLIAAQQLIETTRQVDSGWESCINITLDTLLDFSSIFPYLEEFYQLKSDIEVNLHEHSLAGSLESVLSGQSDLVIGATEPEARYTELAYYELIKTEWRFIVCKNHPLTQLNRIITDSDIQKYRAIVIRDSSIELPSLTKRLINRQTILRVSTMEQKIACQIQGLGVGYLPLNRIKDELQQGLLTILPVDKDNLSSTQYLIWKKTNKGRAVRWFIERIKKG